jgi:acyl carrier protein
MTPLGTGEVRDLLSDSKLFPDLSAGMDDDAELALDSLGLVWLLHQVQERYGLAVEPSDSDIDELISIRRITAYLNEAARREGLVGAAGPVEETR